MTIKERKRNAWKILPYESRNHRSEANGKSSMEIMCPLCGATFIGYIWSLAGTGKKCPGCGTLHTLSGALVE